MLPQNNSLLITDVTITWNVSEELKFGGIWNFFIRIAIFTASDLKDSSEIKEEKKRQCFFFLNFSLKMFNSIILRFKSLQNNKKCWPVDFF